MIYKDGSKYEGNWRNGMRNGQGKYISKTGITQEGNWKENTFIN